MQEATEGDVGGSHPPVEADALREQAGQQGPSVGGELAAARIAQGLEIADVARSLKLSPKQIEALESDDFASMRGNTFVRGFVRSYAKLLQLDPLPLLERFQQRAPAEDHALSAASQQIELPVGAGKRRLIYVAIAALLAIAAPILVYEALHGQQQGAQPVGAFVAPLPAPHPTVVEPAVPPEAAAPAPEELAQVQPLAVPPSPPAAPVTVPEVPRPAPPVVAPQPLPPATPAHEAAAAKASGIKLVFAGQSWVEIRDGRGKIILSELSAAGSERQVDGVPPFSLVVGNATQVRIAYNGEPVDLAPHIRGDVAHLTLK